MRIRTSASTTLGRRFRIAILQVRKSLLSAAVMAVALVSTWMSAAPTYGQRVFGVDTSSVANGVNKPTLAQWQDAYNTGQPSVGINSFQFAFVRSSHGGTNGMPPASDDGHFYDNISNATAAGLLAGSYHYPHADVYTAADDAQHYLNHAGMYMKPGYLLPVFDLEGSSSSLTQAALTTWSLQFIDTIYQAKGIKPIVYTSSSFNTDEVTAEVAFTNIASSPHTGERTYQWLARPSGSLTTGDPVAASGYPDPYGGWDPLYTTKSASTDPAVKPWAFWQNGSGYLDPGGTPQFLVDYNAANGNIEFVRDFLVPALWTNNGSGNWGTIGNWNSDNPDYDGSIENGPAPRLPAYDATNPTLGNRKYDWVKLQNAGGGTVTLSSGAQAVRKFYNEQPLNITGGSLTVNYIPGAGGKWDVPSEFNDTVTISGSATYTAHTTQVDSSNTLGLGVFNIDGGTVNFRDMQLVSHATTPGKIVMGGNATFGDFNSTSTAVIRSTGALAQSGKFDLGSANRTLTINNGSAAVDVSIQAVITGTAAVGAGGLTKAGAGTMQLTATNTYTGGTAINSGILRITKDLNLGAAPGSPDSTNIVLNGGTLQTGSEIASMSLTNAGSGYTSFPSVSFGGAGSDAVAPTANAVGRIASIQLTAGGTGYTAAPKVVIVGGGGTGAIVTATINGSGVVTAFNLVNPGSGYTSVPTVYITDASGAGVTGNGAAAVVSGMTLTGLQLTSSGFDYASPTVSFTGGGGSGATATATPISSNLTLNSNRGIQLGSSGGTLHQTTGTTLTVGGIISSTDTGPLNKSGAGTLILSGTNTYTGNTVINSGALQIGATANLGSASNLLIFNGGTLRTSASITEARNVTLNAGGGTIDASFADTFSGVFSGSGGLTKAGGSALVTLSNNNTYIGTTTISAGTLQIGNGGTTGSLASASIVNNGGLSFDRSNSSTYSGVVSGSGTLTKLGAGTLILTGANTYTGATTISAGTLQVGIGGFSGSLANQGGIVNNGSLIFNRIDTSSYGGAISGSGSVTKTGAGTFTLSGSNSYAGDTNINGGVLQYNVTSNLGASTNEIIINGGTLRTLVAGSQARDVRVNGGGGTIDTNGLNSTFSGVFKGAGLFTKTGAGTLTLTGINTHGGFTTVNEGVLALSGASATLNSEYIEVLGDTPNTALQIQGGVLDAITDTSVLSLLGGGTAGSADQGFADLGGGIMETVASLLLNGVPQAPGTYGSSTSGAMFQNDEYFAGTGVIAVPALGDYNGDFKANAADYVTWRKDSSFGGPNGYETWRANFEQSAAASAGLDGSAVPEPGSIALLLLGLGAMMLRRRVR